LNILSKEIYTSPLFLNRNSYQWLFEKTTSTAISLVESTMARLNQKHLDLDGKINMLPKS